VSSAAFSRQGDLPGSCRKQHGDLAYKHIGSDNPRKITTSGGAWDRCEVQEALALRKLISRIIRSATPRLWQQIKYYQYVTSSWGEREIQIVHRFVDPKRAALDVGVYLGMYTRHFAKYAKEVIGFEANPDCADLARRSLRGIATIEWVALSSEQGTAVLRVPIDGADGSEAALGTVSRRNTLRGFRYREISVPMKILDDFVLPPVGFVKIDVEGHEEAVLAGAQRLVAQHRPVFMIEIEERHNPGSLGRLVRRFESQGYKVLFYDSSELRGIAEFDADTHQTLASRIYINNFFFLPLEFNDY